VTPGRTARPVPDPARAAAVPVDEILADGELAVATPLEEAAVEAGEIVAGGEAAVTTPFDEDAVEAGPPPGSLAFSLQRARRIFDRLFRLPASLKRQLAPELAGFHRHGWSGKLYLMTTAAVLILTTPFAVVFTLLAAASADSPAEAVVALCLVVFLSWLAVVYYRVLRGVARFHRRARKIAMLLLVLGIAGGLTMLGPNASPGERVAAFAEIAISGQFLLYFMLNRDRFLTDGELGRLGRDRRPAEPS
jgi:hypothetical protein